MICKSILVASGPPHYAISQKSPTYRQYRCSPMNRPFLNVTLFLVVSMCCTPCALAVDVIHESQLISPGISNYSLGALAFDGTTLLVSAMNHRSSGGEMVRVFRLDEERKLVEQPSIPGSSWEQKNFGSAMSISGRFALIGESGGYNRTGSVHLYELQTNGWKEVLGSAGSSPYDRMGQSVDLDPHSLIFGMAGKVDNQYGYNGTGVAYIYSTATDWHGDWKATRLQPNGPKFYNFGAAVAVNGSIAVVGAAGEGRELSRAFIFEQDARGQWPQTIALSGDFETGHFGSAVDVKGDLVVVGDPGDYTEGQNWGAAYVFRRQGPYDWGREAKLTMPLTDGWKDFGYSVSIGDDGSILICATGYVNDAPESGAAALFTQNDQGVWSQAVTLLPTVPDWDSHFGHTVAWHNGMAIIAAGTEFPNRTATGAAYAFDLTIPEPTPLALSVFCAAAFFTQRTKRSFTRSGV